MEDFSSTLMPLDSFDDDEGNTEEEIDAVLDSLGPPIASAAASGKIQIPLPAWHRSHSQGRRGYCLSYSAAMVQAIRNCATTPGKNNFQYNANELGNRVYSHTGKTGFDHVRTEVKKGLELNTRKGWTGRRYSAGINGGANWKSTDMTNYAYTHGVQATINHVKNRAIHSLNHKQPFLIGAAINGYQLQYNLRWKPIGPRRFAPYINMSNQPNGIHAMCVFGYDPSDDYFLIKNSWNWTWGDNGCARWKLKDIFRWHETNFLWKPAFFWPSDRPGY